MMYSDPTGHDAVTVTLSNGTTVTAQCNNGVTIMPDGSRPPQGAVVTTSSGVSYQMQGSSGVQVTTVPITLTNGTNATGYVTQQGQTYTSNGDRVTQGTVVYTSNGTYQMQNGSGVQVTPTTISVPGSGGSVVNTTGYITNQGQTYTSNGNRVTQGTVVYTSNGTYQMQNGSGVSVTPTTISVPGPGGSVVNTIGYITEQGQTYTSEGVRVSNGTVVHTSAGDYIMQNGTGVLKSTAGAGNNNTPVTTEDNFDDNELTGNDIVTKSDLIQLKYLASPNGGVLKSSDIKKLQGILKALGFDIGEPDGNIGPATQAAILIFQYSQGLTITGVFDTYTISSLIVSFSKKMNGQDTKVYATFNPEPTDLGDPGGASIKVENRKEASQKDLINVCGYPLQKQAAVAWAYLYTAARENGIAGNLLTIRSGYRSVASQQALWDAAVKKYGSESAARKYVARPGYSEHQTGFAIDFAMSYPLSSSNVEKLKTTTEYEWMIKNAAKYGFYNYSAEPWHWSYNPPK